MIKSEKFPEIDLPLYLKELYCLQLGTHLYSFLHQIIMRRKDKKFFEYVLHHGMALLLIFYSYCTNFIKTGSVVLLVHDFSDIFIVLARGYGDFSFKNRKIVNIIYITAFSIWCYCRLYVYPVYSIFVTTYQIYMVEEKYKYFFFIFLDFLLKLK